MDRWLAADRLSSDYTITETGRLASGNDPIDGLSRNCIFTRLCIHSMKSKLQLAEHSEIAGGWNGRGLVWRPDDRLRLWADGPGMRVISKFGLELEQIPGLERFQIRIGT